MKRLLMAALLVAASACVVRVPPPYRHGHRWGPPPPRVEVIPLRPSPAHVWIGGSWRLDGGTWHWVPGVWVHHRYHGHRVWGS